MRTDQDFRDIYNNAACMMMNGHFDTKTTDVLYKIWSALGRWYVFHLDDEEIDKEHRRAAEDHIAELTNLGINLFDHNQDRPESMNDDELLAWRCTDDS